MSKKQINITKASGKVVPFSAKKLIQSLQRAGAPEDVASSIAETVANTVSEGMSTKKIYRKAFSLLRSQSGPFAARYHLKAAIMELGPSGYPFEKFIGEILKQLGYDVEVGKIVRGRCVKHEIDVIAQKGKHHFMIECKYHNEPGVFSDVKVPLYIQARFKDIESEWTLIPGHENKFHQAWVVTNTRFSTDALQYGTCAGLKMLSWDYPAKDSLKDLIDNMGLYPLTCLTTLTKAEKKTLLDNGSILCKEISSDPRLLEKAGVKKDRINAVLEESHQLCNKSTKGGKY